MSLIQRAARLLAAGFAAAAAGGCASANLASVGAPVPAPDVRAGDAWTYVVLDGFRGFERGQRRFVVKSVQGDTVTVEISDENGAETRRFTRGWNPIDDETPAGNAVTYDPALPLFLFPLEDGARWSQTVTATDARTRARFRVWVDGRVLGRETVTTPAGTFDTVRIQRSLRIGDGETDIWRTDTFQVVTEWYAPAVGRSVRFRHDLNHYFDKMRGRDPMGNRIDWARERLGLVEYVRAPR